jgi:uncharacterized protein (TIGR02099 family)
VNETDRPGRLKLLFRRLRTLLWTALSLVILLAAVLVGVGKLLMPYSARYQPQLEAWLSKEFNQPVKVEAFTGEWKAFGPRISLDGLNLLGAPGQGEAIAIRRAALDIKPLNALIAGRPLYIFRIIGADLELVLAEDGRLELSGLGVTGRGGDSPRPPGNSGLGNLARVGEVRLEESQLAFFDRQRNIEMQLSSLNGRLALDGDQLAVEVHAGITAARNGPVLGDLGVTLQAELDEQRQLASARWHVAAGELMLAALAEPFPEHEFKPASGRLNAELWGEWTRGQAQTMEGVLDIRNIAFTTPSGPLGVTRLNSLFRSRFDDRRKWRIDLSEVEVAEGGREWASNSLSIERHIAGGLGMWVSADYLDVSFPLALAQRILASVNGRWPANMPTAGGGVVKDFDILFNADKKLAAVQGLATGLAITEWGRWPQLSGLDAKVDLLFGEGEARISGQAVELLWPRNFRAPATLAVPACTLDVLWGESWQIDARDCSLRHPAVALSGRARFTGNSGKPFVDLVARADQVDLPALHDYWPESVIKPNVSEWLQRSIVAGTASDLRFSLVGDMDDFPFRENQGSLQALFKLDDAQLDYHPDWPAAKAVSARGVFAGTGMALEGSIGDLAGAAVAQVSASIDDFQAATLKLSYATSAPLDAYQAFIRRSPMLAGSTLDLDDFSFAGAAGIDGRMSIPLGKTPGSFSLAGQLQLAGNGFVHGPSGFTLGELAGAVDYSRGGFSATGLQASYLDWPVQLDLQADWDAARPFLATLEGTLPAATLVAQSPLAGDKLLASVEGSSNWLARLSVEAAGDGAVAETWLELASDLRGTRIDLPAPLEKAAAEAWPFSLRYPVSSADGLFSASLDDSLVLQLAIAPGGTVTQGLLQLGAQPGTLPPPGFFSIGGRTGLLDLDGWLDRLVDYFAARPASGQLQLSEAELQAGELLWLNRLFSDVRMSLDPRDDALEAWFDSQALAGTVRYIRSDTGAHNLWLDMDRLLLPEPVSTGMTMQTDPTRVPELHLYARQFRYLGLDMGATRIEAYPVADGLHIESVVAESEFMNFQARGDWLKEGDSSRSDFDIVITSESLGSLVNALDLSSVLEGGQTMVRFNAWWPGPPASFDLAKLNGAMSFNIVDGNILNADPGAGRMLGLFSVGALPRRLAFDFRDVFASGFSFDQASGNIELVGGVAHTDDLVIESTAAQLKISGSSDLVSQQFDYMMLVRPGVSQALPVIGALAAGPGGAAAGLALQGLLRQALGDAAEARYQVTGPWSEPDVIRLENAPGPGSVNQGLAGPPETKENTP